MVRGSPPAHARSLQLTLAHVTLVSLAVGCDGTKTPGIEATRASPSTGSSSASSADADPGLASARDASTVSQPLAEVPRGASDARDGASASSTASPSEPTRYLVLGDSHVFGSFGTALDEALRSSPARQTWLYGSCGSSPLTWLRGMETPCGGLEHAEGATLHKTFEKYRTPMLGELLSTVRPHHTLIVMGVNFLRFAEESAPNIRLLLDALEKAGTTCTWIGPPEIPDRTSPDGAQVKAHKIMDRLYRVLKSETDGRCTLLDARTIGIRRWDTPDYIHVGPVAAQKWRDAVMQLVASTATKPTPGVTSPLANELDGGPPAEPEPSRMP